MLGNVPSGLQLLRDCGSLFHQIGDRWGEAFSLTSFGDMILDPQDVPMLRPQIEASLRMWRSLGDTWGIGQQLVTTGSLAWYDGDYATAAAQCQEAVDLFGGPLPKIAFHK
jgi:hypothetical protein